MIRVADDMILFALDGAAAVDIVSPWSGPENPLSLRRIMNDGWIYFGSSVVDGSPVIDFLFLNGFSKIARWYLDDSGRYVRQEQFTVAKIGPLGCPVAYRHQNSVQNIVEYGRKYANDFQIYSAVKYLMGDEAAANAFMNAYAPRRDQPRPAEISSKPMFGNFIFNHNYARNIPLIEKAYAGIFHEINYVLPNICPSSERCFAFPAGSYAYQTLIYYLISELLSKRKIVDEAWYLFAHDDVYLNKNFSQDAFANFIAGGEEASCLFSKNVLTVPWDYQSEWMWNKRVLSRLTDQRNSLVGNGFEGSSLFSDPPLLTAGVSDIFFIRGKYLEAFNRILGNFISQDVFPEVAIPSSLKALCHVTETKVGLFTGDFLWRDDRKKVNSDYISSFNSSRKLFVHPVKSDLMVSSRA